LSDRLKGIVSAGILAAVSDRALRVLFLRDDGSRHWFRPSPLVPGVDACHHLVPPPEGRWIDAMDPDVTLVTANTARVVVLFNNIDLYEVLVRRFGSTVSRLSWRQWFRDVVGQLQLSERNQRTFDDFLRDVGASRLVCVQMRFAKNARSVLGTDDAYPIMASDHVPVALRWADAELARDGASNGSAASSSKLLLLTDSEVVRGEVRAKYPAQWVEVSGRIVHVDHTSDGGRGADKTLLDFWAVRRCDSVLFNEKSGFVRQALHMNDRATVVRGLADDGRIVEHPALRVAG
jgi:hypothetical protein